MEGEEERAGKSDVPASGPGLYGWGPLSEGAAWRRVRWSGVGVDRTCVGCGDTMGSRQDRSGIEKAMNYRRRSRRGALLGTAVSQGRTQVPPSVPQEAKPGDPYGEKGQAGSEQGN